MRVFKTKDFARFTRKEKIDDAALCAAIVRAERGLIDADFGGHLIKQRVPRKGRGRSGGYRTIIAYRHADRAMFLHGFAKSSRDNVDDEELENLKGLAAVVLKLSDDGIALAMRRKELLEVRCEAEEI